MATPGSGALVIDRATRRWDGEILRVECRAAHQRAADDSVGARAVEDRTRLSAVEGGVGAGSLRGAVVARAAPSPDALLHGLLFFADGEAGQKKSLWTLPQVRRWLNQV